tara:strand:- start:85 stop:690 length:606 start_codon:yes stop_codon:yes gene_type:complete
MSVLRRQTSEDQHPVHEILRLRNARAACKQLKDNFIAKVLLYVLHRDRSSTHTPQHTPFLKPPSSKPLCLCAFISIHSGGDTNYADRDAIATFWDRPVVDLIARIFGDEYENGGGSARPSTDGGWLKAVPRECAALISAPTKTTARSQHHLLSLFVAIFGGQPNVQRQQLYTHFDFAITKLPRPTQVSNIIFFYMYVSLNS